jgi:predicted acyl esterase
VVASSAPDTDWKAGRQIRLEVSSSNVPMGDRNPNTGHLFGQDARL